MLNYDNDHSKNGKKQLHPQPVSDAEFKLLSEKRWVDSYDVCRLFNISRGTLYNWCEAGVLVYSKIKGKKYFDMQDIHKMLEEAKGKR